MSPASPKGRDFPVSLNGMGSMAAKRLTVVTVTEFQAPSVVVPRLQK